MQAKWIKFDLGLTLGALIIFLSKLLVVFSNYIFQSNPPTHIPPYSLAFIHRFKWRKGSMLQYMVGVLHFVYYTEHVSWHSPQTIKIRITQ